MPKLQLLKARLDPEVRNVLPKDVPLDLCFEELRPATNLLDVEAFGAQITLAGLWQSAKIVAQNDMTFLGPILALSVGTEAGIMQSVAIFHFSLQLDEQYSAADMSVDHYVLLCSCLEVC